MQNFLQLLEPLGSPYSDLAAVAILTIALYLIVLIITSLFGKREEKPVDAEVEAKPDEVKAKTQVDEVAAPEIEDEFKSSVEPQIIEETKDAAVSEVKPTVEKAPQKEVPDAFKSPEVKEAEKSVEPEPPKEVKTKEPPLQEQAAEIREPKESFFSKLTSGLSKTQQGIFGRLGTVFTGGKIDDNMWDEFEEVLITSDIGVATTMKLREKLSLKLTGDSSSNIDGLKNALKEEVLEILKKAEGSPSNPNEKPNVMMVAGVNGVGKTTTIGKLANLFSSEGNKVMVAAADTFRAAAVEQLEVWANRVGSDFLKGKTGADPSAVAFDAVEASKARGVDILIVDTAGRLHTKSNLMDELKKLRRVIGKAQEGAPHETLLVLDATTGQNAVQQAKLFNEAIEVTGIVLTKLDGTAKGGVIITIADELNIPVKYIGVGEGLNDLRDFKAEEFVEALFMSENTIH